MNLNIQFITDGYYTGLPNFLNMRSLVNLNVIFKVIHDHFCHIFLDKFVQILIPSDISDISWWNYYWYSSTWNRDLNWSLNWWQTENKYITNRNPEPRVYQWIQGLCNDIFTPFNFTHKCQNSSVTANNHEKKIQHPSAHELVGCPLTELTVAHIVFAKLKQSPDVIPTVRGLRFFH